MTGSERSLKFPDPMDSEGGLGLHRRFLKRRVFEGQKSVSRGTDGRTDRQGIVHLGWRDKEVGVVCLFSCFFPCWIVGICLMQKVN